MDDSLFLSSHIVFTHLGVSNSKISDEERTLASYIDESMQAILDDYEITKIFDILSYDIIVDRLNIGLEQIIESINKSNDYSYYFWLDNPLVIVDKSYIDKIEHEPYNKIIDMVKTDEKFYSNKFVVVIFDISMFKRNVPFLIIK